MVRLTCSTFLFILVAVLTPTIGNAEKGYDLRLQDAISEALVSNPGLKKMTSKAKALTHLPPQLGALPDPHLSLNARNLPTDTFNTEQEAMTQFQIGIMQGFPFPGKLDLKKGASLYQAQAAEKSDRLRGSPPLKTTTGVPMA